MFLGGEDAEISSPIHRTEANFYVDDSKSPISNIDKPRRGLNRLADLAQNINQWEDETTKKETKKQSPSKRSWKPKAPQPPISSPQKTETPKKKPAPPAPTKTNENVKETPKQLNFDKNVLATLVSLT